MKLKDTIKTLIGIDVTTDSLEALLNYPEDYVVSKEDYRKLSALIELIDMALSPEVHFYDYK